MFLVWTAVRFIPALVGLHIIILAMKYLERVMLVTEKPCNIICSEL